MIPKTFLDYSWIYNQFLGKLSGKEFNEKDLAKLKKKFAKFEKLYYEKIEKILELIEKHNEPWQKKAIRIYPVNEDIPYSFSNPLTLKYNKSEKYLLAVLIHELIHNNFSKKRFPNRKETHKHIAKVMEKICLELGLNLEKERKKLEEVTGV